MTVVRNELEMGQNNPNSVLLQQVVAAAYQWHNYGHAPIGARSDVEQVGIERLQAFYRRYYQPDNAVLVITGKFDRDATLERVARYFGADAAAGTGARRAYRGAAAGRPARGDPEPDRRCAGGDGALPYRSGRPCRYGGDGAAGRHPHQRAGRPPLPRRSRAARHRRRAASCARSGSGLCDLRRRGRQDKPLAPAREALLAELEGFAARPVTADELERCPHAAAERLRRDPERPRRLRAGLVGNHRQGRLAPVPDRPRPHRASQHGRRAARGTALSAAGQPHPGPVRANRPAAAHDHSGTARRAEIAAMVDGYRANRRRLRSPRSIPRRPISRPARCGPRSPTACSSACCRSRRAAAA